jgi:hypothetical protein
MEEWRNGGVEEWRSGGIGGVEGMESGKVIGNRERANSERRRRGVHMYAIES